MTPANKTSSPNHLLVAAMSLASAILCIAILFRELNRPGKDASDFFMWGFFAAISLTTALIWSLRYMRMRRTR